YIIPFIIFVIVLYGVIKKIDVYEIFIDGAFEGMEIVVKIVPTLIGLFLAVRILNDSGALDAVTFMLKPLSALLNTPDCVIPVIITKLFSSGSATSLMLNIYSKYGPDSLEGLTSAIILSSTESLFYTLSVFLMAAKVKKSGYIIPCALLSIMAGVIASIIIANHLFASTY
ncbi:MAG: nucleoside recognition domain-containing protein, partial [Coprococcus sp.]